MRKTNLFLFVWRAIRALLVLLFLTALAGFLAAAVTAHAAETDTTYTWSADGRYPVTAERDDVSVRVDWDTERGLPRSVTWNDGGVHRFTYDARGRRIATHDGAGHELSRVEYTQKEGFPFRVRETTPQGTRTLFLDDAYRVTHLVDTTEDERVATTVRYATNGLPARIEYRIEPLHQTQFHFDGGDIQDGLILEARYDEVPVRADEAGAAPCSSLPPDSLQVVTRALGSVPEPRARLTTWLLTGGTKWKASDEEIRFASSDMWRKDTWANTAAGYGALIGVVAVFENIYILSYDFGRAAFYDDTRNNTFVDLTRALFEHGPQILIDGFVEQGRRAMRGDAVAFGEFGLSVAMVAEGLKSIDVTPVDVSFPQPFPVVIASGEVVLSRGAIAAIAEEAGELGAAEGGLAEAEATAAAETGALAETEADALASTSDAGAEAVSDPWSREPLSLQDEMALKAAKEGQGELVDIELNDPRFRGMQKMEFKLKSTNGRDSVVHYVRNPETGELMDFKFKKHSIEGRGAWESKPDPRSSPTGQ